MIRGADTSIKDQKGRVPSNLISDVKDKKMRDELYRIMVIIIKFTFFRDDQGNLNAFK
jgi:uncharacterized protein (DUF934 family)